MGVEKSRPKAKAKRNAATSGGRTATKAPVNRGATAKLAAKATASKATASKATASKTAMAKPGDGARIAEGSKAPAFSLPDDSGKVVSSASLAGQPYVLYFYPKDDTPGCTREACDFRDNLRAFSSQKLRVIGVSPDDPGRHTKFKQKYGLTFTLLSDTDKTLANAYGVWVEKQNYGRKYLGVERSTFLIDKTGTIKKAWHRVRVPGHVEAVLASG